MGTTESSVKYIVFDEIGFNCYESEYNVKDSKFSLNIIYFYCCIEVKKIFVISMAVYWNFKI